MTTVRLDAANTTVEPGPFVMPLESISLSSADGTAELVGTVNDLAEIAAGILALLAELS